MKKLKNPLTLTGGTGVTLSNSGVGFDGTSPIDQSITVGNDISQSGNVQFNTVTASAGYDLGGFTLKADRWESNFSAGGSIDITGNLTIPGNGTVGVKVIAQRIESELTSSGIIFQSGSTKFGDTPDDIHNITGSVYQSGSFSLLGYSLNEFSNDITLADGSSTTLTTENASKSYTISEIGSAGDPTTIDVYLRKSYNKTASSVSNNTASFSAFSASAGSLTATNETDFLFFNNGQAMEHDALQIQQSGGTFYLIADPDSLGYNLANDDEIKAWGRFEPAGYLFFDGETNEVTTAFSGSGATPVNKTYSWWMNTSDPELNQGVFAYGTNKREAFLINASQSSMGKPLIRFANHMYKYFMTPGHEEQGGGTSGNSDSGASEGTAHISAQDDGKWHHWMLFTGASDPQSSSLYIDGVEQDTAKFGNTGTLNTQTDPLTIGTIDSGTTENEHFSGSLKEFSVFSGDKTGNASTYYNNGTPYDVTNEDDLQGYWKMIENQGTIAYDSSGEGNNGTIDGASWITQ
jgi:hypothetical protein